MGLIVNQFTYNNYKYVDTYHRCGILKRDKARKLMTIVIYVYKNKQTRDENPLNNFLVLTKDVNPSQFCKYFDCKNLDIEMQCYLYLQQQVKDFHTINYQNATNVFETEEQQFEYDEYMAKLQAQQEALIEQYEQEFEKEKF